MSDTTSIESVKEQLNEFAMDHELMLGFVDHEDDPGKVKLRLIKSPDLLDDRDKLEEEIVSFVSSTSAVFLGKVTDSVTVSVGIYIPDDDSPVVLDIIYPKTEYAMNCILTYIQLMGSDDPLLTL